MKQPPKKSVTDNEPQAADAQPLQGEAVSDSASIAPSVVAERPRPSSADVLGLTDGEIEEALRALRAEARRRDVERAESRPRVGSKVRILSGRPRYVGKIGTAVIVRRSRCFVSVPELASPAYALISDLELLER